MRLPLPFPFAKLLGPSTTILGVLALGFLLLTGRISLDSISKMFSSTPSTASNETPPPAKPENKITIATFNVQTFGESKVGKEDVMSELSRICKMFDVIAMQEIRSPQSEPVQNLVKRMNADGASQYTFVLSTQIGRSTSPSHREQYAFIFDSARIRLSNDPSRTYVMNDELDLMHREPFVASFTAIPQGEDTRTPFSFTLINVHTDPDEVTGAAGTGNELDVLADVYVNVRAWEYSRHGEDDFILLGDLNTSSTKLFGLAKIPGLTSLTAGLPTNTPGSKELDHILMDSITTREFTGQANVVDYSLLQISPEMASDISDHRPVWAQFSAFEVPPYDPAIASTGQPVR